jgi:hypothetical protein
MNVLQPCLQLVQKRGFNLLAYGRLDDNCATVLCRLPDNSVTPYVTWVYAYGGFSHGHYFRDLEDARQDFTERFHHVRSRETEAA